MSEYSRCIDGVLTEYIYIYIYLVGHMMALAQETAR